MRIQEFDYNVDVMQAILWQYAETTNLFALINNKRQWYEIFQTIFWLDWYDDVFNLLTANQFGLSVWAYILDVPLYVSPGDIDVNAPTFGFNEDPSINTYVNFENGNFSPFGSIIFLTPEEQRLVLRLKYYKLISRGSITQTNEMLAELFTNPGTPYDGTVWVLDGFNMTIRYIFNFTVPPAFKIVLIDEDLLPRPAGVGIEYIDSTQAIFGFGLFYQNFENGTFLQDF